MWYYQENNEQAGPVTEEQVKELISSSKITAQTLVWKEGMAQWATAESSELGSLISQASATPPSDPSTPPPPASASEEKPQAVGLSSEETTMGMLAHIGSLSGFVIPFGNILAPLIIWLVKKDESEFIADQGKESLNFQITVFIAGVVAFVLSFVVIGLILLPIIALAWLILSVLAGIEANKGVKYRYPFCIRLIK